MVERFKRFLPKTEPWHSFGRGALAALTVGALELLGTPWWLLALAAAVLLTLFFHGAPEPRTHLVLGLFTVIGALGAIPLARESGVMASFAWMLVIGAAVGTGSAAARLAVRRAYLATGLVETGLTLAALAIAASAGIIGHLAAALAIFLLYEERFRRRSLPGVGGMLALAPSVRRAQASAGVLALFAFQGSFIVSFLPLTPLQAALLLTLLIVLIREAVSLAFLGELTKVRVVQGVLAGLVGSLLLFSAVPWSV